MEKELTEFGIENPIVRKFDTGATRNIDENKLDYDGFISPSAMEEFAKYMQSHRKQKDGKIRDSDNWQKGIPIDAYRKSLIRHTMDFWNLCRGGTPINPDNGELCTKKELLCAIIFNAQGYLHEELKHEKTLG